MQLSDQEAAALRESLLRMHLIEPGEQPVLTLLTGGVSSLIVRADTARGAVCIKQALAQLRVTALWFAPVRRNRAEVAWMQEAQRICPSAVPALLGDDPAGNAFAMVFLAPEDYPNWKAQMRDGRVDVSAARAVAECLVTIHAATADRADLAARFANQADFHALRLAPYFEAAAERHPDCAGPLRALVETTAATRRALMHGDVSPKNILLGPQGPVLLDAECACYGDPAFDLAFCLTHLLLKSVWKPDLRQACLACFDAAAEVYLSAAGWEPSADIERRATFLLAGLLLARIDGKSPVEYLVDTPAASTVRRFAKQLLHAPVDRLSTLRHQWNAQIE